MPKKKGKRYESLLEKIAAATGLEVDDVKNAATQEVETQEDKALQRQSIINFYRTHIEAKEPTQRTGESRLEFTKRLVEWQNARNEWKFRDCENCKLTFAYAYHYEGVKFCSLDCLDAELRKIGIEITPQRPPHLRWGLVHPAVVPASALRSLQVAYPSAFDNEIENAQ